MPVWIEEGTTNTFEEAQAQGDHRELREVEIMLGQGRTTAEACRRIAVSEQTYYRWRKEYGGLKTDQARRMKDLEKENLRLRRLTIIDEASRECLALVVSRQLRHEDVLAALADLFIERGPPAHISSENGSEFIAIAVQTWLGQIGVKTLYIARGRHGRTATTRASTARFATSCSTARYSAASPRPGC